MLVGWQEGHLLQCSVVGRRGRASSNLGNEDRLKKDRVCLCDILTRGSVSEEGSSSTCGRSVCIL